MTVQEVVDAVLEGGGPDDDLALQAFMAMIGVVRSAAHGEPATEEGCWYALDAMVSAGICEVSMEGLEEFERKFPRLMGLEVPDRVVLAWAEAVD